MPTYHLFQLHPGPGQAFDAVFDARFGKVGPALKMGLHRAVAKLEASDLEDLFSRTNSIDGPWYAAEGIELLVPGGAPSTSVGDIAIDADDGQAWLCASFGWEKIDRALCEVLFQKAGIAPAEADDRPEGP